MVKIDDWIKTKLLYGSRSPFQRRNQKDNGASAQLRASRTPPAVTAGTTPHTASRSRQVTVLTRRFAGILLEKVTQVLERDRHRCRSVDAPSDLSG